MVQLIGKAIKRAENRFHISVAQYHMDEISGDFIPAPCIQSYQSAVKKMQVLSIELEKWDRDNAQSSDEIPTGTG